MEKKLKSALFKKLSSSHQSVLGFLLGEVKPLPADDDALDLRRAFVDLVDLGIAHQFLNLKKRKELDNFSIYASSLLLIFHYI